MNLWHCSPLMSLVNRAFFASLGSECCLEMSSAIEHNLPVAQHLSVNINTVEETAFAHGCAMMIPKRVLNNVGPMHEDYFLYYDEHDWSNAIKKAGYKIYFQPESEVYQSLSSSRSLLLSWSRTTLISMFLFNFR